MSSSNIGQMVVNAVMVLGGQANTELAPLLFDVEAEVVNVSAMEDAIERLNTGSFLAVIVDARNTETDEDLLDIVITIRDASPHIPILVLSLSDDNIHYQNNLAPLGRIYLIDEKGTIRKLTMG